MKRLPALLLSIAVLLALLPADVLAVDTMTTSSEGLAFIQDFEGYEEYAYQDGGEWYIGYGTQCERDEYPYGISREEAEEIERLIRDARGWCVMEGSTEILRMIVSGNVLA